MRRDFIFVLLLASQVLPSQAQPLDARSILQRANQSYSNLKSLEFSASVVLQTAVQDYEQTTKSTVTVSAEPPAKIRVEVKSLPAVTLVSDGSTTWLYNGALNQYTTNTMGSPLSLALSRTFPSNGGGLLGPNDQQAVIHSVRSVPGEEIQVGSRSYPCYVLDVQYTPKLSMPTGQQPATARLWVEQENYLVLRQTTSQRLPIASLSDKLVDLKVSISMTSLRINAALPESLFTFVPPPNAKLVAATPGPASRVPPFVGKPAPPFRLRDLSDNSVELSKSIGKTVVITFWATWCAPCRAEVPVLKKLLNESKDIELLAINVREDPDTVRKFVAEQQITYPVLLSGESSVVREYGVEGYPTTIVIDRNGIVRSHLIGFGAESETQLRAALSQADAGVASQAAPKQEEVPPPAAPPVHKIGSGVSSPKLTLKVDPEYTEEARQARIEGVVVLSAVINSQGVPEQIKIVRPLDSGLDQKAIAAVKQWRFAPAMKDGQPVAVRAQMEVNFRLIIR